MLQTDEANQKQKRIGSTRAARRAKSPSGPRRNNSSSPGGDNGTSRETTQIDIPAGSIFEKLTDPKEYTGHHKHRFNAETGQGLGLDGRDRNVKGTGTEMVAPVTANGDTLDIVHLMRPNLHNALTTSSPRSPGGASTKDGSVGKGSPRNQIADRPATARARLEHSGRTAKTKSPRAKSPRPDSPGVRLSRGERSDRTPGVFNRLSDPARFTGHHKYRFDEENRGRGLAGRDSVVKGGGTNVDSQAQVLRLREKQGAAEADAIAQPGYGQAMVFSPRAVAAAERERQTALMIADAAGSPRLSDAGSGVESPISPQHRALVREV